MILMAADNFSSQPRRGNLENRARVWGITKPSLLPVISHRMPNCLMDIITRYIINPIKSCLALSVTTWTPPPAATSSGIKYYGLNFFQTRPPDIISNIFISVVVVILVLTNLSNNLSTTSQILLDSIPILLFQALHKLLLDNNKNDIRASWIILI